MRKTNIGYVIYFVLLVSFICGVAQLLLRAAKGPHLEFGCEKNYINARGEDSGECS